MSIEYCNVTTDLHEVFRSIDDYRGSRLLDSSKWVLHSGSIYKYRNSGYVDYLYEDDVRLDRMRGVGRIYNTIFPSGNAMSDSTGEANATGVALITTNATDSVDALVKKTGSYSVRISPALSGLGSWAAWWQLPDGSIEAEEYYFYDFWVYALPGCVKQLYGVDVGIYDGASVAAKIVSNAHYFPEYGAWFQVKGELKIPKGTTFSTGPYLGISMEWTGVSGAVYLDDCILKLSNVDRAGEFFYDSEEDTLYLQTSSPSTKTYLVGEDWDAFKKRCRNDAQEMLEGFLKSKYAVPFQKVHYPGESYNGRDYDWWIRYCTALLTCYLIVKRVNPLDPAADALFRQVYNPENLNIGEKPGIVQMILNGDITLRTQLSARETGGFNVYELDGNSGGGQIVVGGRYTGTDHEIWKLEIVQAGAPGTALFRLSYDDGGTWDLDNKETLPANGDGRRISLNHGLWVEFYGNFSLYDAWRIDLYPEGDRSPIVRSGSVRLSR